MLQVQRKINSKVAKAIGEVKTDRHYQTSAVSEILEHIVNGIKKICNVSDTGTGKTYTAKLLLESKRLRLLLGKNKDHQIKVLWITHRSNLVSQAREEIIPNGNNPLIEFIPQLTTRDIPEGLEFDIVIHDEAHHEPTISFQKMLPKLEKYIQIGLTAEVDRGDLRLSKYEKIVSIMTRLQAEEEGWILQPDLHSVINVADNIVKPLQRLHKFHPSLFERGVVFLQTKADANIMFEYFKTSINPKTNQLYKVCDAVNVSNQKLVDNLKAFSNNEYDMIVTVDKIGEGTDLRNVRSVILARNINSKNILNQFVGRGVRTDVPYCTVVEFFNPLKNNLTTTSVVGNTNSHHMYNFRNGTYDVTPYIKVKI